MVTTARRVKQMGAHRPGKMSCAAQEAGIVLDFGRQLTDAKMSDFWPSELKVSKDRRMLSVTFNDGIVATLPAELLRVLSPSAEVQGHGPGQKVTVPGKRDVAIRAVAPTGNYAVRIAFDDGHDSGIFTWSYLRELGETGEAKFAEYERELAEKGLSRDRR
ncbi:unnamed protein product [Ciceribacter sp. T2.26MG-112.2]|nr:unnamed protein product [Ciceribacter naphthalenivorans]